MSIEYGGDKIVATDGGSLNPISAINRNRLIDAGFTINQRVYVSNTALSSGVYAHDRWKAGSSGCTYTFTQGSLGVPITITITAGSLQQVIEGCNMPEGGTYVLSWEGTAQARFNGGSYGSSPLAVTGITAGANTTIEFNTGTVLKPQLEVGSSATSFDYRPYGTELALCQRYYQALAYLDSSVIGFGLMYSSTSGQVILTFAQTMRANATVTLPPAGQTSGTISFLTSSGNYPASTGTNTVPYATKNMCSIQGSGYSASFTTGNASWLYPTGNNTIQVSAEL